MGVVARLTKEALPRISPVKTLHLSLMATGLALAMLSPAALSAEEKKAEPRRLPVYVQPGPKEESLSGIVKATKGRVVVFEDGRSFLVTDETQYFRATPFDLVDATAGILRPKTALLAVGKHDKEGRLVAVRVNTHFMNVLPAPPSGPDRMEWGTTAVAEGVEGDRILLDQNRYIPIDKQTKFYINTRTELLPADRSAITKGATIGFNISGRPAVLKGEEPGVVTVTYVTVRKPAEEVSK